MREETKHTIASVVMVLAVIFLLGSTAKCQEQYIRACQQSYACRLASGVSWAAPIQTFVFTPYAPNESVRIYIHNNNTSSAHTAQTIAAFTTGSTTANASLINNSDIWVPAALIDNTTAGAKCVNINANNKTTPGASGTGTCYSVGMWGAQIAIQFTPGGAQAGSPDTFDIDIVQQPSVYPGGAQPGADSSAGANCIFSTQANLNPCPEVAAAGRAFGAAPVITPAVYAVSTDGGVVIAGENGAIGTNGANALSTASQTNATVSGTLDSTLTGILTTSAPVVWSATSQGTATQCSASVAASATGKKHFITGCTVCVAAGATAQTPIFANLRDGASGAGTVKYAETLAAITNTTFCTDFKGMGMGVIQGTANTAATCELSAASNATVACTANIQGYDQ